MNNDQWREIQLAIRERRYRDAGASPRVPRRRQMVGIEARLWSFLALWLVAAIVLAAVVWLV